MERIDLAREIENSLDYEWQIFLAFAGDDIVNRDGT